MSTHFLIRRAALLRRCRIALASMETAIERELLLPKANGHPGTLERMAIDTDSRPRVLLSVDMDAEDFVLYQVATPEGEGARGRLLLDATGWPAESWSSAC